MINTIEIKWDLLGAKLASLGDEEQGQFFKGFARELDHYESSYLTEVQMLHIRDKLGAKEKLILENYLPYLWYTGEAKP